MSYIGRKPTVGNFQICDAISVVNGQAAYTMQVGSVNVIPQSSNHMIVSLNGTIQKPGGANPSFTVSGSTITFASNLATGDVIDFIQILGDVLDLGVPSDSTVSLAKLTATGTKDATTFLRGDNTFASAGSPSIVDNGNATAITIDSSENVGIGTSSPQNKLDITALTWDDGLTIKTTGNTNVGIIADANRTSAGGGLLNLQSRWNGTEVAGILFTAGSDTTNKDDGKILFRTASAGTPTERMRILSGGGVVIAKTSETIDDAGHEFRTNGFCAHTRTSDTVLLINRMGSDGTLQEFEAAGNLEGTISVSGSTVSYNGFTGTHWSRFQNNSTPTILRGTVLETLDEMCDWYNLEFDIITQDDDGNDVTSTKKVSHVLLDNQSVGNTVTYNHKGTDYEATIVKETDVKHMMSKVSDTTDAKNVYGVFVAYDLDGEGYNDFYVASVGSFVVRIKANETIAKGDLLQSNGDGTAKVQTDDNIKSSSFAKVLSTTVIETYDDGSFIVPCSLMC